MNRVRHWRAGRAAMRRAGSSDAGVCAEALEPRAMLALLSVTTTADDGPGSLRQVILTSNSIPGADFIRFDIPGEPGTVRTIRPLSPLPPLVEGLVTLDGRTQPGYAGTPLIELDGSGAGPGADGLRGPLAVIGLVVNRFSRHGIVLTGGAPGVGVQSSYIGTTAGGDVAAGNLGAGIYLVGSALVGGSGDARVDASTRNVISGNGVGVWVDALARGTIAGNYIGTDVTGTRAVPNLMEGVRVDSTGVGTTVGGIVPGAGNVISGNGASGVKVGSRGEATILGNRIGTDATGTAAVANGWSPIQSYQDGISTVDAARVRIGGPSEAARNLISGNAAAGVGVYGAASSIIDVQGNFIGTDAGGSNALGNGGDGVLVHGPPPTTSQSPRRSILGNLISGNGGHGVHMSAIGATVGGNYIGTDAAGARALGNAGNGVESTGPFLAVGQPGPVAVAVTPRIDPAGTRRNIISGNGGHGVHARDGEGFVVNSFVGTDATGTRRVGNAGHGMMFEGRMPAVGTGFRLPGGDRGNVISGNAGHGILLRGVAANSRTALQGNRIGTDASGGRGAEPLGNGGHGIAVIDSAGVLIGDDDDEPGNTIAFNAGSGVRVEGADPSRQGQPATAEILRNSIFANGGLGIDLVAAADDATGVTPNDPTDADRGPNGLQNFPVLISATPVAGGTTVSMTITSVPNAQVRVDLFASRSPDPSGHGEGHTFLRSHVVELGNTGSRRLNMTVAPVRPGQYVTATVTWGGQTSEFSRAMRVGERDVRRRVAYRETLAPAGAARSLPLEILADKVAVGGGDVAGVDGVGRAVGVGGPGVAVPRRRAGG